MFKELKGFFCGQEKYFLGSENDFNWYVYTCSEYLFLFFGYRQDDPPPTLLQIQQLSCQSCDEVPLNWAVVDNGDIAFYSFNLVDLPRDISFV